MRPGYKKVLDFHFGKSPIYNIHTYIVCDTLHTLQCSQERIYITKAQCSLYMYLGRCIQFPFPEGSASEELENTTKMAHHKYYSVFSQHQGVLTYTVWELGLSSGCFADALLFT